VGWVACGFSDMRKRELPKGKQLSRTGGPWWLQLTFSFLEKHI